MKLFWRSIVFLAVASVAPLAFGQATTTWQSDAFDDNLSGSFTDSTRWSNGVPNANKAGTISVFNFNNLINNNNNNITISVPAGQSAAALTFSQRFDQTYQGTINLNLVPGATLTLGGSGLSGSQPSLLVQQGIITTISGGALSILSGPTVVGSPLGFFNAGTDTLDLSAVTVNYGSSNSIMVGAVPFTGVEAAVMNENNGASVTTGGTFTLQIGTTGTVNLFGQANGSYSLTGSSTLSLGANSLIQIGNGTLTVDATSSVTVGAGSTIDIGVVPGDSASITTAGNLNLSTSTVLVGANNADGATNGTLTQTGGTISGNATIVIGGFGGTGIYNLQGGSATFSQGLFVGGVNGFGTINQTAGSLTVNGQESQFGVLGGTGVYNLQGGSVDFKQGVEFGSGGSLTQGTGSVLTSEGASSVDSGATYTMGGASATFSGGLAVNGTLVLNSGVFQVADNGLSGNGTINFGGGTLKFTSVPGVTDYTYGFGGTLNGGTSTIDLSSAGLNSFTFSNALTGSGGISLIGSGNTEFDFASAADSSVNNAYSGPTSINGGTLFATQNDLQNNVATTSSLTVGSTGTLNLTLKSGGMAFAGPINGTGTIALNFFNASGDAFVMPSANGFDGTVALGANGNAGTLQIYNGTFANITDNGTGSSVTIGGTPLVAGSFTAPTSGTVFLPGANTYTGLTTINSGFTVLANHFSGNVAYSGALATSTYPIGGGSSTPSSLTIQGTLNAVPSGLVGAAPPTLLIFANGQTADTFFVNNNGNPADTSTISGVISVKGSGTNTYDVVQATTGTLTLGTVTTVPTGSLFSYEIVGLVDNNTKLEVQTTQNTFSSFAQTPAQRAVAGSLDPLTQNPPASIAPLLTVFNSMSNSEIPLALGQLSSQSLQFTRDIAFENSTFLVQRLDSVLSNLRSGYAGLDLNGVSCTLPGFESGLGQSMQSMLASNAPSFHTTAPNGVNYYPDDGSGTQTNPGASDYQQPSAPSRMTPSQSASPTTSNGQVLSDSPVAMGSATPDLRTSRFSEFVAGDVALANIDQNNSQDIPSKVTYTSGGVTAGVSYRMTSNLSAGVLLDYNHTYAKTDGNGSNTTVNSISPGIYATFFEKGFYLNGLFAFGFNNYHNNRDVSFLGGTATSSPKGQQYTANIDAGYDFHPSKEWVVGPTVGLTYTHLNVDSFSESGVPLANLNVDSESFDSLRSHLGAHVGYQTRVGSMVLQPNVTAIWQHEFLNNSQGITSSFQDYATAAPFTTPMASTTTDSALLGAGLTATLDNSMAFFLNYLADVGGNDYLTQSIVGGVKASF